MEHLHHPVCIPLSRRTFLRAGALALPGLLASARRAHATALAAPGAPRVNLRFLSPHVALVRRAEWARTAPYVARLRPAGAFTRITVHHTGATVITDTARTEVARDLNGVLDAHRKMRYGDIGYHFIVDYGGCVWEGRPLAYEGAHVSGENEGNIGVMLLGNFEKQAPSSSQTAAMRRLVAALEAQFSIAPVRVYGHRDIGASVCPGQHLYPHVHNLRTSA